MMMKLLSTGRFLVFLLVLMIAFHADSQEMKYISSSIQMMNKPATHTWRLQVNTEGSKDPLSVLALKCRNLLPPSNSKILYYYTGSKESVDNSPVDSLLTRKKKNWSFSHPVTLKEGANYFWFTTTADNNIDIKSFELGIQEYQLVWSDEFDGDSLNRNNWNFEHGFVRNNESQWYQEENAVCSNGILTIEAKKKSKANPNYSAGSKDWRRSRDSIRITSSSINTRGKQSWLYGRFEMQGKIDTVSGYWPAWWTLGLSKRWPSNGEIDIMEFYRGKILANIAVGTGTPSKALWFSNTKAIKSFADPRWRDQFHSWRMDWDEQGIALYVDDLLMNYQPQKDLYNRDNTGYYPFKQEQYMLLNLAVGGDNGGSIEHTSFPLKYEVDYVRVSQKIKGKFSNIHNYKPTRR